MRTQISGLYQLKKQCEKTAMTAAGLFILGVFLAMPGATTSKTASAAPDPIPIVVPTPKVKITGSTHIAGLDTSQIKNIEISHLDPEPEAEPMMQLSEKDAALLKQIAMAEMESEGLRAKALCIRVILNRVESDVWPNTIEGVIFDGHQFSPTFDGRWEQCCNPDEECAEALEMVLSGWDESEGATYFRTTVRSRDTWHDRALVYLYEEGTTSFYREH